jgi:hypothetical protein
MRGRFTPIAGRRFAVWPTERPGVPFRFVTSRVHTAAEWRLVAAAWLYLHFPRASWSRRLWWGMVAGTWWLVRYFPPLAWLWWLGGRFWQFLRFALYVYGFLTVLLFWNPDTLRVLYVDPVRWMIATVPHLGQAIHNGLVFSVITVLILVSGSTIVLDALGVPTDPIMGLGGWWARQVDGLRRWFPVTLYGRQFARGDGDPRMDPRAPWAWGDRLGQGERAQWDADQCVTPDMMAAVHTSREDAARGRYARTSAVHRIRPAGSPAGF